MEHPLGACTRQGLSTYAPPARKAALDGQAARLERIAGNLSSMKVCWCAPLHVCIYRRWPASTRQLP
jgi:hypothetical protein